jgi:hypothetical protein
MLIGDLATFKSYRKKNNLLARQMDARFIIKNVAPKKSLVGEAGDYVAIDTDGEPTIIKKGEFEETYEVVTE